MPSVSKSARIVPLQDSRFSADRLTQIKIVPRQIRTRRKRWLELNSAYFESASADLELSDPLAYDRLIRQHQTTAERESEGRRRGWASTLETSLLRSEAKMAEADSSNPKYHGTSYAIRQSDNTDQARRKGPGIDWTIEDYESEPDSDPSINAIPEFSDDSSQRNNSRPQTDAKSRQLGQHQWHSLLAQRFIDGYDENFDYSKVDGDDTLDEEWMGQKDQEAWFSEEEAALESHEGETGIQDF